MSKKGKKNLARERIGFYSPIYTEIFNDKELDTGKHRIVSSSNVDYPRFEYGFHHFIHSDKNKMVELEAFKGKKKVYHVINKFERYVDDYDKDIGAMSKQFFSPRPAIITRGFYKMWELFFYFDLIDKKSTNFTSIHISEGPNPFVQATSYYRDMYCNAKNDTYHTLKGGDTTKQQDDYAAKYKKHLKFHDSASKIMGGVGKADLITGDRGKEWNNENIQEQESFDMVFEQIVCAVANQKKGGHFVCKFFETFTQTSMKYLSLLTNLYDNVHLVKPLSSRGSNSEKYAVCINFKLSDKDAKAMTKKLSDMMGSINKLKKGEYLVDMFPGHKFDIKFRTSVMNLNKNIANEQLKEINQIISYINETNYHGDAYRAYREEQIKANDFWCRLFLVDGKGLESSREEAQSILKKDQMGMTEEYNRLLKIITGVKSKQARVAGKKTTKKATKKATKKTTKKSSKSKSTKKRVKVVKTKTKSKSTKKRTKKR